ncbi:MAG: hypothetical protein DRP78_06100 [Candidatus Omnitrophota bacterium]|nr:MAG: hypothetical protein DRP78_06100 [Candidatus Omnitrophota bacterium]
MKSLKNNYLICLISIFAICGCATTGNKAFKTSESQVELRSIQTRAFDMTDKKLMMQTVISTLQDLDFVVRKADLILGSVTGSKFLGNAVVAMTVTIRPRGEKQLLVRVNAQIGIRSVEDAETYQDFFNALGKALFLAAHKVD